MALLIISHADLYVTRGECLLTKQTLKQVIIVPYAGMVSLFSGRFFKHFTNLCKGSLTSHWNAVVSRIE